MTAPRYSFGQCTAISSIGSSRATVAGFAASRSARAPADWKAMSDESTEWALPSWSVTLTSTIGCPLIVPLASWAAMPFSTEPMNWRGTAPPTTSSTKVKPLPRSPGSTRMSQIAYWPWPPDCLT